MTVTIYVSVASRFTPLEGLLQYWCADAETDNEDSPEDVKRYLREARVSDGLLDIIPVTDPAVEGILDKPTKFRDSFLIDRGRTAITLRCLRDEDEDKDLYLLFAPGFNKDLPKIMAAEKISSFLKRFDPNKVFVVRPRGSNRSLHQQRASQRLNWDERRQEPRWNDENYAYISDEQLKQAWAALGKDDFL